MAQDNTSGVFGPGKTVEVVDDEEGSVSFEEGESVEELLQVAGIKESQTMATPLGELGEDVPEEKLQEFNLEDELEDVQIRKRLPEKAELTEENRLRAESARGSGRGNYDYLNGRRRFVLLKLSEGMTPTEIIEEYGITDSYVYRARKAFSFLLENDFLKSVFLKEDGKYAPPLAYPTEMEEEEMEELTKEEDTEEEEVEELGDIVEIEESELDEEVEEAIETIKGDENEALQQVLHQMYEAGKVEGKVEAIKELEKKEEDSLFSPEEWWEVMEALIHNGKREFAQRIIENVELSTEG